AHDAVGKGMIADFTPLRELALQNGLCFRGDLLANEEVAADDPFRLEDGDLLLIEKNTWIRQIDGFGKLEDDGGLYVKLLSTDRDPALRAYLEYYIFGRYHSLEIPLIG
ncbi:MAG: hypothetical protein J6U63_01070, partial [Clostridia bacterium]|nr:hypothetical protein [Clostridia bacterium]